MGKTVFTHLVILLGVCFLTLFNVYEAVVISQQLTTIRQHLTKGGNASWKE